MLCAQKSQGLRKPGHLYELKLDGVRILAEVDTGTAKLFYRSQRSAKTQFPEIETALLALRCTRAVLDGELVTFDDAGRPSFERLQQRLSQHGRDAQVVAQRVPVALVVFDLLELDGLDLRPLPLRARRQVLGELITERSIVSTLDGLEDDGSLLFAMCEAQSLEGVVGKDLSAPYQEGQRTGAWFKVKLERQATFHIVGYTRGEGSRSRLGALELAERDARGAFVWRGRVGSGLTDAMVERLLSDLRPFERSAPVLDAPFDKKERVWTEPAFHAKVRYLGVSREGRLRFPVLLGVERAPVSHPSAPSVRKTP
jgi:bifunctional non-homologous end joining protein LigD